MLACIKLGVVVIPATTLLGPRDLADRVERGKVRARRDRVGRHREVRRRPRRLDPDRGRCRRSPAGCATTTRFEHLDTFTAEVETQGRRDPAALLHQRHDGPAEAGRAHPHVLPGRAPVHGVLDRPAARRRAPQRLLARLGEARVEQRLRAVDRRGDRVRRQPAAVRRRRRCSTRWPGAASRRSARRRRCGGCSCRRTSRRPPGAVAARGGRRRRAAEPRGDRAGAAGLGHDGARRLRPDRDHRADRQPAGCPAQARLDGPAAARATPSPCSTRSPPRPAPRARSASTSPPGRPR